MKKIILAAMAGFVAALIGTGGAAATDMRTLSEFLLACKNSPRICQGTMVDYLRAADDQGFVCVPKELALEHAVSQELDWLRQQAAIDAALNNGFAEDAQWTAINTLWPCKQEQPQEQPQPQPTTPPEQPQPPQ